MKPHLLLAALLVTSLGHGADDAMSLAPLPQGWSRMSGDGGPEGLPGTCEIGVDSGKSTPDRQVYSVRCTNDGVPSFGGARNTVRTASFRSKRVRVSAWLMASGIQGVSSPQYAGVAGEGGMWLGVGSPRNGMRSDRMQGRAIKGSTDWEYRDFVVDVPDDNNQMFIGYWMQGKGQLWVRDFKIEEVSTTVPVNFLVADPGRVVGPDLSLLTTAAARPEDRFLPPPAKWLAKGSTGFELCDIGVDVQMLKDGQRNLSIACNVEQTPLLRQAFEAAPFWGKRVRLSGWVKTQGFEPMAGGGGQAGAGLFMTNTGSNAPELRANATQAAEWQSRELVMDVPRNSTWIIIGLALRGRGQVWARDLKFEEVSRDTPLTPTSVVTF